MTLRSVVECFASYISTSMNVLPVAKQLACVASVSMGSRGKELPCEKREGRGRGRKETLSDKPLDFENRPLCLSCLTDFMLSSSIQVASHANVLRLVTRDKPKNVCVGG